ncbi:FkbM family methyltransferase, partial [Roseococcus sp. DSY-14]|uniref:FkbM family methyltransferase n=1 Tax=Roseococcus sp. DSY-14 TaxID=3369650 RepID=UPI00387B7BE1
WAAACAAAWGGPVPAHPVRIAGQPHRVRGQPADEAWRALGERGAEPEAERLARLARAWRPGGGDGAVALDAGANLGVTVLALAAAWPGHAALHAAEPDPEVAELLRWNLRAAGLDRARVWPLALGATDGEAAFRRELPNRATSHLFPHDRPARDWKGETLRVPLRRADTLLAEAGATRLDLLKLDVEGAEEPVLAGAAAALERFRPLVLVEFNLFTQMTLARENPFAVLERLATLAPHLCWFRDDGAPEAVTHPDGRLGVLHAIMAGRAGVDDLVLCHDLDWMERWE